MRHFLQCAALVMLVFVAHTISAAPSDFGPGPVIKGFGQIADVPNAEPIPKDMVIKMAYDVREGGVDAEVNKTFNSTAGLINSLVDAGVGQERIKLALVIHGPAYRDILNDSAYGGQNPNVALVEQLLNNGVDIYFCGQAAVYRDVAPEDLIPGIKLSLSATAAHAVLQMQGYAVRPY